MTSTISKKATLTLENLVLHYGPIELQSPLSRDTFVALAEYYPDLRMERETNGITTLQRESIYLSFGSGSGNGGGLCR